MASVSKGAAGWRAQVYVKGVRESRVFRTRREADAWAAARETALRVEAALPDAEKRTLRDALRRYAAEVSPKKRGAAKEAIRLHAFEGPNHVLPLDIPLASVTSADMARWRDARLARVKPGSVLREIGALSDVFEVCRREWRWLAVNPLREMRKPAAPAHRERIISRAEIRIMLRTMGYRPRAPIRTVSQATAAAFLLSLRTGMRAGEITGLTWDRVHDRHIVLTVTKTTPREVPLSRKARRVVEKMRGFDAARVFGLTPQTLDALFRRYRQRAGLDGFTFHDARHTAATWIGRSGVIGLPELCRMFGWKNPAQAMVYFNARAADIAEKLDR